MIKVLLHIKFGFRDLQEALDFYEKVEGNHVVKAAYWGDGTDEEIFYVNKPTKYEGDPDTGMKEYELALRYQSFVNGSVDTPTEEFSYLPGWRGVKRQE